MFSDERVELDDNVDEGLNTSMINELFVLGERGEWDSKVVHEGIEGVFIEITKKTASSMVTFHGKNLAKVSN